MRPLMNYIVTNSVTLSEHLTDHKIEQKLDEELNDFVPQLRQNLTIIDNARNAISAIPLALNFFHHKK